MIEFKNDNDYSVVVFSADVRLVTVGYVNSLGSLVLWLNRSQNYRNWDTLNVYVRRSRRFLRQYKRGQYIPAKPS